MKIYNCSVFGGDGCLYDVAYTKDIASLNAYLVNLYINKGWTATGFTCIDCGDDSLETINKKLTCTNCQLLVCNAPIDAIKAKAKELKLDFIEEENMEYFKTIDELVTEVNNNKHSFKLVKIKTK